MDKEESRRELRKQERKEMKNPRNKSGQRRKGEKDVRSKFKKMLSRESQDYQYVSNIDR